MKLRSFCQVLLLLIVVGVLGLTASALFVKNEWKRGVSQEDYNLEVMQIEQAPDLPERFYLIFGKLYSYDQHTIYDDFFADTGLL